MGASFSDLCSEIQELEKLFHDKDGYVINPVIHDVEAFQIWKGKLLVELPSIRNEANALAVDEALSLLNKISSGVYDRKYFNELKGVLMGLNSDSNETFHEKKPKLFISHSSNDKAIVEYLVDVLLDLGLDQNTLFCSSYPGYNIPLDEEIYDYISKQFHEYDVHVLFILSDEYYKSVASLNEMGATWILKKNYTSFLLPGFKFTDIRGAISPTKISISLDENDDLRPRLNEFKDKIINEFNLKKIEDNRWNRKRDLFIKAIQAVQNDDNEISENEKRVLSIMHDNTSGTLMKSFDLSGVTIGSDTTTLYDHGSAEELALWEEVIGELDKKGYIEISGIRRGKYTTYKLLNRGYQYFRNAADSK